VPFARARAAVGTYDFLGAYVDDLPNVVDIAAIRDAGRAHRRRPARRGRGRLLGAIAERHGLDLTVVNPLVDATWRFMTLDWDGKIRMDCSSPSAMASLIAKRDGL
jgi:phosphoglucomutase